MKFPRLDETLDRRRKLMTKDISVIFALQRRGNSITSIARKFGVATGTIRRYLDVDYKNRANDRTKKWLQNKYKDPVYYAKAKKDAVASNRYKYKVNPKLVKYLGSLNKKRLARNKIAVI